MSDPPSAAAVEATPEPSETALALGGEAHNVVVPPLAPSGMNPVDAYLAALNTVAARETAVASLKRALATLGMDPEKWRTIRWAALGPEKSRELYRRLVDGFKPATARLTLSIVRGVLGQAKALGQLGADRYEAVAGKHVWRPIKAESAPTGRMLSRDEIRRIRVYCGTLPDLRAAMVWAIFACALGGGLRRFEIAELRADALSDDGRHLLVYGKGNKEVIQPIAASVGCAVEAWLAQREAAGIEDERMFVPLTPQGARRTGDITKFGIWRIIRATGRAAKVAPFTPHDLRRTYASRLIGQRDVSTAQKLMRHKDPRTTIRYDRRPDELAAKAAEELGILEEAEDEG